MLDRGTLSEKQKPSIRRAFFCTIGTGMMVEMRGLEE